MSNAAPHQPSSNGGFSLLAAAAAAETDATPQASPERHRLFGESLPNSSPPFASPPPFSTPFAAAPPSQTPDPFLAFGAVAAPVSAARQDKHGSRSRTKPPMTHKAESSSKPDAAASASASASASPLKAAAKIKTAAASFAMSSPPFAAPMMTREMMQTTGVTPAGNCFGFGGPAHTQSAGVPLRFQLEPGLKRPCKRIVALVDVQPEQGQKQHAEEAATASDPLGLLLPLLLIETRVASGLAPMPKELVSIIFGYAHQVDCHWELQFRKDDWRDEHSGQVQSFCSLSSLLRTMAQSMPAIDPANLRRWQAKVISERYGPFWAGNEMPQWDQLIEQQVTADEYLSDAFFEPPQIDSERRDAIEASGRVAVPIDRVSLYCRLRTRLQCGEVRASRSLVTLLGEANGQLFHHDLNAAHFLTVREKTSVEYGEWSMSKVEEYFHDGGDYE